jgi:hypothetical protein
MRRHRRVVGASEGGGRRQLNVANTRRYRTAQGKSKKKRKNKIEYYHRTNPPLYLPFFLIRNLSLKVLIATTIFFL